MFFFTYFSSLFGFLILEFVGFLSRWISKLETLLINVVLSISFWTCWFRRKSIITSFSASCFSNVDTLLFNNSTTNRYYLSLSFSFSGVPTLWLCTDKLVIKFSIYSNFFFNRFCKIFHCLCFFQKHVLGRNKTLGVVIIYQFNWSSRSN